MKNKRGIRTIVMSVLVTLYILVLMYTLFINGIGNIYYDGIGLKRYLRSNVNIIPFYAVAEYMNNFIDDPWSTRIILATLTKNFVLFMPMAVIFPCFFKRGESWKTFILAMVILLCSINLLQLVTRTATADIDEFIVNLSGACVMFAIMKLNIVRKVTSMWYAGSNE